MAETTDFAPSCSGGGVCCGGCQKGRDGTLKVLLGEMQALGAVLPGLIPPAEGDRAMSDRTTRAGSSARPF